MPSTKTQPADAQLEPSTVKDEPEASAAPEAAPPPTGTEPEASAAPEAAPPPTGTEPEASAAPEAVPPPTGTGPEASVTSEAVPPPTGTEPGAEAPMLGERAVGPAGVRLGGPFLAFYDHFGPTICGQPIGEVVIEEGRRRQYFQCLALEEYEPGRVRLVRLGEAWHALRELRDTSANVLRPPMVDVSRQLRRDPAQHYVSRPLCDIRYLVIHHTGASAGVGPEDIAAEHVEANGWPGIGYHYVVDLAGTLYATQDLTTVSYHVRQFNPAAVGIALMGDLTASQPSPVQIDATAALIAGLLFDLGLPSDAVRGHREMVPTSCPGESFLRVWKPRLMQAVLDRLGARAAERANSLQGALPSGR